jgi:hypothetical protein
MIRFNIKELENEVPDGFIRFDCWLEYISFYPGLKSIYISIKIHNKTLLVDSRKVNIGYRPGAKCECYKNKLAIDMPEDMARQHKLHPTGLEALKYM